ncbi:MAG: hypothetical protein ABIS14_02950 [Sphingomonas sp.]
MIAALLLVLAAPQTPTPLPTCGATPAALPADLAGWIHGRSLTAAAKSRNVDSVTLQPGVRADVALLASSQVAYAFAPQKASVPGSFGGMLGIAATHAGTYRIALGSTAWVNVVGVGGKPLAAVAHTHGPDCTGVRKIVDFALQRGSYIVQIEGSSAPTIGVMVVAKA